MRFIMYGAGGIGSVVGGHLSRCGYDVVLVGNRNHMERIRSEGLRLVTGDGTFVVRIPVANTAIDLAPFHEGDILMLCVKSQHTMKALGQLKGAGAPNDLPIFCFQNSILNESMASRIFHNIHGAVLYVDGIFVTPGEVVNPVAGNYGFLEVGCFPSGTDQSCLEVTKALQTAGFAAFVNPEVMKPKAAKLLGNLSNPLYAITNGRGNLDILSDKLQHEAKEVWSAAGIEWEELESLLKRRNANHGKEVNLSGYEDLMRKEGGGKSSSWQSLMRQTGSIEAEQLNGDVVTLGRMVGIDTPYNELIWKISEEMARNREKPGKYTADELMTMLKRH